MPKLKRTDREWSLDDTSTDWLFDDDEEYRCYYHEKWIRFMAAAGMDNGALLGTGMGQHGFNRLDNKYPNLGKLVDMLAEATVYEQTIKELAEPRLPAASASVVSQDD